MELTKEEKKTLRDALTKQIQFYRDCARGVFADTPAYEKLIAANEALKRELK